MPEICLKYARNVLEIPLKVTFVLFTSSSVDTEIDSGHSEIYGMIKISYPLFHCVLMVVLPVIQILIYSLHHILSIIIRLK